jgi:hypothetical protein
MACNDRGMITPETFSRISKPLNYAGEITDEIPRQDLMQASAALEPGVFGFLMYVYAGDIQSRHDFFAGLFMEVMQDPVTQTWIQQRKMQGGYYRALETLCLISIMEWGTYKPYTQQMRSGLMGVSRGTWSRKYQDMYQHIMSIPKGWQVEAVEKLSKLLR